MLRYKAASKKTLASSNSGAITPVMLYFISKIKFQVTLMLIIIFAITTDGVLISLIIAVVISVDISVLTSRH